jgi:hypothetical protein
MATRRLSRNDPCHCGSGRKYKKCCLATEPFPRQDYAIGHPQPVYGEDATGNRAGAARPDPPQLESIVRVSVGYTFDESFGRAEVHYCFPTGQLVILDNNFVLPVERLEPGMRMRLEDGHIATITEVDEPKTWEPPSHTPTPDGRYASGFWGRSSESASSCLTSWWMAKPSRPRRAISSGRLIGSDGSLRGPYELARGSGLETARSSQ